jgi:signal transduction histidine kinase
MLMPTSQEFIALCQAQITLLTDGWGAALSVVYLTEEPTEADAKLVPIVAYPEAAASWGAEQVFALLSRSRPGNTFPQRLLSADGAMLSVPGNFPALPGSAGFNSLPIAETSLLRQQQIVIPLVHEGVMMGLLVTARADRPWNQQESAEIDQIAQTLANACILDQRAQWVEQELRQQRSLQAQQHDVFDDLLHQFRNPLTALRTFGKLLVRRLLPSDANQEVATGIVRESDRLQELLKQFDAAIDLGEADLLPPNLSAAESLDWEARLESNLQSGQGQSAAKPAALLPSANFLTGAVLKLESHTIAEVLEPLLVSAMAIAQERQITLQTHLPQHLSLVRTDLKALREVLNNLIDNALKYTPAGGKLHICTGLQYRSEHGVMQGIAIADTGVGIPPQDLPHLFERHYRGVQANTDIPGTGLGLAIARDLVQQIQGEIQVFSPVADSGLIGLESQNTSGTVFIVWLPE